MSIHHNSTNEAVCGSIFSASLATMAINYLKEIVPNFTLTFVEEYVKSSKTSFDQKPVYKGVKPLIHFSEVFY